MRFWLFVAVSACLIAFGDAGLEQILSTSLHAQSQTTASGPDGDQDGLTDLEELTVHATNPRSADTDRDGQLDGDEVKAGTDPLSTESVLRILSLPQAVSPAGWRVRWSSVVGRRYTLQRADKADGPWRAVAELVASEATTSAQDTTPSPGGHGFYRVSLADVRGAPVLSAPVALPGRGWRFQWTSQEGETYRLERTELFPVNLLSWQAVVTTTATGPTTEADDLQAPSARQQFYRVVLVEGGPDTQVPTVTLAAPQSPVVQAEGLIALDVQARDDRGVSQVTLHDAGVQLGAAQKVGADTWRFLWPVAAGLNGTHSLTASAHDAAGNTATSSPVAITVSIARPADGGVFGNVGFKSDRFETNGSRILPLGNPRAGLASLPTNGSTVIGSAAGTATGDGPVSLPGLGVVYRGRFQLDLNSGILVPARAFAGPFEPVVLNSRVTLLPRNLQVHVATGSLEGEGVLRVGLSADTNQVAILEGHFHYDPTTQQVDIHSTASYAGVEGTGDILLRLAENTFELTGEVLVRGGTNTVHKLTQAQFNLRNKSDGSPEFFLSGKPDIASLSALGVVLSGTMDLDGRIALNGSGAGALGDLQFSPLLVKLLRTDATRATLVTFSGSLVVPRLAYTSLTGVIRPDGSIAGLTSTAEIELGNGLRIRPKRDDQSNAIPVITLRSSSNGVHTFKVSGTFLTPEAGGVKPVEVEGPLLLESQGGGLRLLSMTLTNRLPLINWPLPKQIKLGNASVMLLYTNNDFMARMKGSVVLSREAEADITLGLDVGLGINVTDPEDIVFDAVMAVDGIGVAKQVYLGAATFELLVGTKPARGGLALLDGTIGLLPVGPVDLSRTNAPDGSTNTAAGSTNTVAGSTNAPTKLRRGDFRLFVEHAAASLEFSGNDFVAELTNGLLRLPPIFTNLPPGICPNQGSGPSVGLKKNSSLLFELRKDPEPNVTLRATGALDFNNIVVFPNVKGFAAELCRAQLYFNPGGLPFLTNLDGTISFPFPGNQTNKVRIMNGAWGLNGFPSGTVALGGDLSVYSNAATTLKLLGLGNTNCPKGLSVTAAPAQPGRLPKLTLSGGMEFTLPADLVTSYEGDRVRGVACAVLTLDPDNPQRPELELPTLAIGGTFHLGGASGLILSNGLLTLRNPDNFFELSPARTASVTVEGTVFVPRGPAFSLQDARLTFFDVERPPRFTVAGMGYSEASFEVIQKIPARVKAARMSFKNPELTLPDLLKPGNVTIQFSATMSLPSASNPLVAGTIDDMKVNFNDQGIPSIESLHGLTFSIGDMKLPPLEAMGGKVHIRDDSKKPAAPVPGLADITPPNLPEIPDPTKLFFAGSIEGSYDGYKLKVLLAFSPSGVAGVCLDFNAGSLGIPLDGGALGGILLSGASGGVAFNRGDADPCDFTAWLDPDGNPKNGVIGFPPQKISWEDLTAKIDSMEEKADKFHQWLADHHALPPPAQPGAIPGLQGFDTPSLAGSLPHVRYTNEFGLPCPGDCPPPTVNIFCQPHPNQERFPKHVIFKFSSIEESVLNGLGFTPGWVEVRFNAGGDWVSKVARDLVQGLRVEILGRIPQPDPARLGGQAALELKAIIDGAVDKMVEEFSQVVMERIASEQNAQAVYDKIRDLAYEGAPCQDISLSMSGTFTYEAVSSFLSGTVGSTVTTAGSAGVTGRINLLGVPVGNGRLYVAGTDDQGQPNPSVCGEIDASFGPFSFGGMRAAYSCKGCSEHTAEIFASLFLCLSDEFVRPIVAQVAPRVVVTGRTRFQIIADLTPPEVLAVVGRVYASPTLPADVRQCFRQQVQSVIELINPEFLLCGEVRPRVFGLSLGPSLMSGGLEVNKHGFTGVGAYSPSFMVALPLVAAASSTGGGALVAAAGPLAVSLFAQDQAVYGYSLEVPDPAEILMAGIDGRLNSVQSVSNYVEQQFNLLLQNATYTFQYSLSPLGFKTVEAQSRLLMPNFLNHPAYPGSTWVRPEQRTGGLPLPSRLDLVLSALTNHLQGSTLGLVSDPKWKGGEADLSRAFAGTTNEARLQGLSLLQDYFPHGGVIGGGYIQVPKALYEAPPKELGVMLDARQDALSRLSAAAAYLFDYVLKSDQAGNLGFYIPAPNPPVFTDSQGQALTPRVMMDALHQFDPSNLRVPRLYPLGEFFMRGYFDGKLLGIPVVAGTLEMALADPDQATEGLFRVQGRVPAGSWLDPFVAGAQLIFEMKGAPPAPIEVTFSNLLAQVNAATNGSPTEATLNGMLDTVLEQVERSMPKVRLEADLPLTLPDPIDDVLAFTSDTHLHAYSPRYQPGFEPLNKGPMARVKREGGIAFQGNASLRANGSTILAVKNAELSVVPQASGPPAVSGQFIAPRLPLPPLGLNNVQIDFSSSPVPSFSARGVLDPLNLGVFSLQGLSGNSVTGRFDVASAGQNATTASLWVSPARLFSGALFNQSLLIHGATRKDDFTLSTTGPWNATVEITNGITLRQAGITLVELQSAGLLSPITLSGTGLERGSFTANLAGGSTLVIFPGTAYAQTVVLKQAGTGQLVVNSDGTFVLTGETGADLVLAGFPGLSVAKVGGGASFRLTQDELVLTGSLGGGVLGQVGGAGLLASGSVTITRGGSATVSGSAGFSVQPFGFDQFSIEGQGGGPMTGSINSAGLTLNGARVRLAGILTNTLPKFTLTPGGDFGVPFGPAASVVGGYASAGVQGQFGRTNGVWSAQGVVASLSVPALAGDPQVTLRGSISSDGTFAWAGNLAPGPSIPVSGASFGQVGGGATIQLQRTRKASVFTTALTVTGTLSGGSLAGFPVPSGQTSFRIGSDRSVSVATGFTLQPTWFGIFRLSGQNGSPLEVSLSNSGLSLTNGAELAVSNIVNGTSTAVQQFPTPVFTVAPDGSFQVSFSASSSDVAGFNLRNATLTLRRTGVAATPPLALSLDVSATLNDIGGLLPALALSGTITNNGALGLKVAGQTGSIGGYAFSGINAVLAKRPGIDGSLALDAQLDVRPTFTARLTGVATRTAAGTAVTLNFDGPVTVPGFTLDPANLNLTVPAGGTGRMAFSGSLNLPVGDPGVQLLGFAGVIQPNGTFAISNTVPNLSMFGIPLNGVTNVIRRGGGSYAAGVMSDLPQAYWRLGESSGTRAASETGATFDGTYGGKSSPTLGEKGAIPGDPNFSAGFAGDQNVQIPNLPAFTNLASAITLEAWVRVGTFDRTWQTIVSKGDSAWRLQRDGNNNTLAFDTDGLNPPYLAGHTPVNDGQWHHVVAVYDGLAKYIYIDGELDATVLASGTIQLNTFPVMIGDNAQTGKRGWNGWIDEVAIYRYALSPWRIRDHYQSGGGTVLSTEARLGYPGTDGVQLSGSLGGGGTMDLSAFVFDTRLGGFQLQYAYFHVTRVAGNPATVFAQGNVTIPGLPTALLKGTVRAGEILDLEASVGGASVLGFNLNNFGFHLTGTASAASMSAQADLDVPGLGTLNLSGPVFNSGDFSLLANPPWNSLFGFPIDTGSLQTGFKHQSSSYPVLIAGTPFVIKDNGDAPAGYWRLNEASGTTALDSQKVVNATLRNPGTYVGGVILGQPGALEGADNAGTTSARFDGNTGYVTIANESRFDFTQRMAVEAWIKVGAWNRSWQAIVTKGDSSWRLTRYADSSVVSFETTSASGNHSLPGQRGLNDNRWHHVVAVYDGLGKYLYVDGTLEAFAPFSEPLNQNDAPVMIGENAEANGRHFNGWIDEVAVYAHKLSPNQVMAHYLAGGGAGITASATLALPGFQRLDIDGLVSRAGTGSLVASSDTVGLPFFSLDQAQVVLAKRPSLPAMVQMSGSVVTPAGTLGFAGAVDTGGGYSFEASPEGSFTAGGRTFDYVGKVTLSPNTLQLSSKAHYGDFGFDGTFKTVKNVGTSFSGSTSGGTGWIDFGLAPDTSPPFVKPARPSAKFNWSASAGYDGSTFSASISGSLDVLDTVGITRTYNFGPMGLPDTGSISLGTPITFTDPKGNKIGTFCFDLIHNTKCP